MTPASIEAKVPRFTRRLLVGIIAGFIAILLMLGAIGVTLNQSHRAIQRDLELIADVEEPESAAAYEMEINILGAGLAVKKYLLNGDSGQYERLAKDEADFDRFHAEYARLGDLEIEQELARALAAMNGRYRAVGRELMQLRDQRAALHVQLASDIEEADRIFADTDFADPEREAKYRETRRLAADIGELGAWLGTFHAGANAPQRERVSDDMANIREHVATFQELPLDPNERELAVRIAGVVDRIANGMQGMLRLSDAIEDRVAEFGRLRDEMDELLDEGIQARTRAELGTAHNDARANLSRLKWMSLLLILISALVSLAAAIVIGRRSLQLRDVTVEELQASLSRLSALERVRSALLRRLVAAQEEERARIARELHDQLSQDLSALSLGLASVAHAASASGNGPTCQREIRALQDLTGRIADEVHFVAWRLRPAVLDDLGLHGALSHLAENWTRHSGVPVDLYSEGGQIRLPAERETALYRVAQEALTNVAKHARARSVSVVLTRLADDVRLVVEDDGCGFDVRSLLNHGSPEGRLGLLGMRERVELAGGSLEFDSSPGEGTTIVASIPLDVQGQDGEVP